jgi:hypothetical protein
MMVQRFGIEGAAYTMLGIALTHFGLAYMSVKPILGVPRPRLMPKVYEVKNVIFEMKKHFIDKQ